MSDILRLTGMVSGMDTDSLVQKLIQFDQIKVDKAKQEKQYLEWQKEDYREIANLLRGFQDEYFDVLNPATNMRSGSAFNMFTGKATVAGVSSSAVSIVTSSSSIAGNFTIDSVSQLATEDKYTSGSEVLGNLTTGVMDTIGNINAQIDIDNQMSFTFDGVTKIIELNQTDYADYDAFAADLSVQLQDAFTNVDITAEVSGGNQLEFKIYSSGTVVEEAGHGLSVNSTNPDLLNLVQLKDGQSSNVNTAETLSDVFGRVGDSSLTINGTSFTFTDDTTITEVMSEVNSSFAGVTLSFDSFSDKFTLKSNSVGSDSVIDITDTDGLLSDMKLQGGTESYTAASNAVLEVNGVTTSRSSNTFEINGTSVTLNSIPTAPIEVSINTDTSEVKDLVVKFVDSYNEMISKVTELVSSERNYDYSPLTDEQKEAMSDEDIEVWQTKARRGTLSDDATLEKITSSLRVALYESVEGVGITLSEIGIQTSSNYLSKGKLVINEGKLDSVLSERTNEVIELFTKESDITYTSYVDQETRRSENGLSNRIYDILRDNIRITGNNSGQKGYLIEKAGPEFGIDTSSDMADKLKLMDSKIDDLLDLLGRQEEKYYQQFARMESAMSSLSAQGDWLASQFGG